MGKKKDKQLTMEWQEFKDKVIAAGAPPEYFNGFDSIQEFHAYLQHYWDTLDAEQRNTTARRMNVIADNEELIKLDDGRWAVVEATKSTP